MGWTQDELADRLGVGKPAVARYEQGSRDPGAAIKRKYFELSGGQVEPNDWYDVPTWRKLLAVAASLLSREAA